MTQEVIDATCQCLIAQAEESERLSTAEHQAERLVLEEFGRCLVQIIDCASKTEGNHAIYLIFSIENGDYLVQF